jgi:site-specific DNA recombinase
VEANTAFVGYLKMFQAKEEVLNLYSLIMEERFKKARTTKSTESKDRQAKLEKLTTRLKNAKEMMLDGEMERSEYKQLKAEIELEIERLTNAQTATNGLEDDYKLYGRKGISILKDLATIYASADLQRKQQIQGAIFPEKLVYSEKNYRTKTLHPIFEAVTATEAAFRGKRNRKDQHFSDLSCQVARTGIEPVSKV